MAGTRAAEIVGRANSEFGPGQGQDGDDTDDPLAPWCEYISCIEQSSIKRPRESKLCIFQECFNKFKDCEHYKNDIRFVKICVKYAEMEENTLDFLGNMYVQGIGVSCAELYIALLNQLILKNWYKAATSVLEVALRRIQLLPTDESTFWKLRDFLVCTKENKAEMNSLQLDDLSFEGLELGKHQGQRAPNQEISEAEMKWKESEAGIKMKNYSNDESHCDKLVEMEKNESFPTGLIQENIIKILQQSGLDAPLEERLFLDELPDSEKMNDDVTTSSIQNPSLIVEEVVTSEQEKEAEKELKDVSFDVLDAFKAAPGTSSHSQDWMGAGKSDQAMSSEPQWSEKNESKDEETEVCPKPSSSFEPDWGGQKDFEDLQTPPKAEVPPLKALLCAFDPDWTDQDTEEKTNFGSALLRATHNNFRQTRDWSDRNSTEGDNNFSPLTSWCKSGSSTFNVGFNLSKSSLSSSFDSAAANVTDSSVANASSSMWVEALSFKSDVSTKAEAGPSPIKTENDGFSVLDLVLDLQTGSKVKSSDSIKTESESLSLDTSKNKSDSFLSVASCSSTKHDVATFDASLEELMPSRISDEFISHFESSTAFSPPWPDDASMIVHDYSTKTNRASVISRPSTSSRGKALYEDASDDDIQVVESKLNEGNNDDIVEVLRIETKKSESAFHKPKRRRRRGSHSNPTPSGSDVVEEVDLTDWKRLVVPATNSPVLIDDDSDVIAIDVSPRNKRRSSEDIADVPAKVKAKRAWECPICFEQPCSQEVATTLCGHVFCKPCIEGHIATRHNCPTCRTDLVNKPLITLFNFV